MAPLPSSPLLEFARRLQSAASFKDLLALTLAEVASFGYSHAWLLVADREDAEEMRLIDVVGSEAAQAWHQAPALRIRGDAMLEEMVRTGAPVVVADARTDPRTDPAMVERWQNRTLLHVPLMLVDRPFGALGVGTFGDEGPRPPTPEQLDRLVGMASLLSVAVGRVRFQEERELHARQMQEAAERLFESQRLESVGQLAGGLAHDFNNLLTVIIASADVLRDRVADDALATRLVREIAMAADRSGELSSQLLAFSRRQMLAPSVFDPARVLLDLEPLLRRLLGERAEFVIRAETGGGRVFADRGQLERVLVNLSVNARDAMPQGGRLTIELGYDDAARLDDRPPECRLAGPCAVIIVSDTGVGMDEATLRRIFDPFFTTKELGRGTGLGLATVRGIVEQSGGTIRVASQPGAGTTFTLLWPLTRQAETTPVRAAGPSATGSREARTVLVVDDDPHVLAALAESLRSRGCRVLTAGGAEAALAVVREGSEPVHLLLSDVVMPEVDGLELARRIRDLRPGIPVLLMSAYARVVAEAGADAPQGAVILPKPFTTEALLAGMDRVLGTSASS
jgi:signal transduction histidine kinase/CheY-like chemotaxis protein